MSRNIDMMIPASGRMLKEDNSVVNVAELFAQLAEAIGEKSGTPAVNTMLGLLKAIEANTGNVKIEAESVNLNTDTLEALAGDIITALAGVLNVQLSGSITTLAPTVETVGVVSSEILEANANRKYAIIINDSDTVVYLGIGVAAELNKGIRLNANGGSYEMSNTIGNLALGAINAITSAADKIVLVNEGV